MGPRPDLLQAKLSLLPSLPLDVLFEIFGHLPPLDILHLSRTTKRLRSILMHKSAISIWKSSLRQISDLPACPEDMSLPAWANLVYSPHCHNCLENKVLKVDWLLRIRLCESCIKLLLQCVPFSNYHIPLRARLCSRPLRRYKGKCCLVEDERKFLEDLQAADDKTAFVKSRKAELVARQSHATECKMWVGSLTQERGDELAQIRNKRRIEISNKLEELGFIEELEYLEGLNRYTVCPPLLLLDDHPDVKVNKPLTERSWKNMEPRLIEYMGEVKAHYEAADRLAIVRKRERVAVSAWVQFRLRYPAEKLVPSGTDILSWKSVKAIIELPSTVPTREKDVGIAATVKAEEAESKLAPTVIYPASFMRVFESMAHTYLVSEWERKRLQKLSDQVPLGQTKYWYNSRSASEDTQALQLAACVFTCEDKYSIHRAYPHFHNVYPAMWYPEFLHHPCNTVTNKHAYDENVPENPLFRAPKEINWCYRKEWSAKSMFFDRKASRAVERVLEACGLDPNVVTTEQMDKMDPRFICLKCSYGAKCDGQRPRTVMPWRNAVQHCMLVHWGDASVTWERITEESAVLARKLSAAAGIATNIWRCAHCRDSRLERDGKKTEDLMQDHLDE
ncbi:hypothetical protein B0H14DRAFT_2332732 [Mycena olivaceomarginata]|nr:hypothetical protein B0H14DRAFT_2332732 [Mycena olivaceomarginata]